MSFRHFVSNFKIPVNKIKNMEKSKKSKKSKNIEGAKLQVPENYGGLGILYLRTMLDHLDKIHQVDTVTGVTETKGSVRTRSIRVAQELRNWGVAENDIVIISSRSHADQTVAVLATLLLGAIVAPMDQELTHKDRLLMVQELKPKVCFCDLRPLKQIERVVEEIKMVSKLVHFGDQQDEAVSFKKLVGGNNLLSGKQNTEFNAKYIANPRRHIAFILPTQGATSARKLVCISHHSIHVQTQIFLQFLNNPEKIISYYPLTWLMQVTLTCLSFQTCAVRILTGTFTERTTCKLIHDLKIDYAFLSTDYAMAIVDNVAVRDFNLSCLKYVIVGAVSTTAVEMTRMISRLPKVRFSQMYCTTETGIVTACLPEKYEESLEKTGTAGKIVMNCKARLLDIKTREELGPEKYGELQISGDGLMLGYLKNLTLTKAMMDGDFFKTGDLAKYDNENWFYIEGRIQDMLMIDGRAVPPRIYEQVIITHPFVKDVVVIGNEKDLIACVIINPETRLDSGKLMTFISERLPYDKKPTKIVFLDVFPQTSLGKVKKDILREQYLRVTIERSDSTAVMKTPEDDLIEEDNEMIKK